MRASLALLACLFATPAAAACQAVPDLAASLRASVPATGYVGEVPASVVPTVRAWLESEGLPHRADRIVQVVGDRGLALVLIQGERACDGTTLVRILGPQAAALAGLVRRFREMRGWGPELGA